MISGPADDTAATFTPDGRTVYFTRGNGEDYDILTSHFDGARWSQPVIAPFSGHWRDLEPAMAPDGSYLIFASSRPLAAGGKPLDGHWNGQAYPGRGGHLWRVNLREGAPSAPSLLPDTINRYDSVFSPAVAADGSLYFMAATGPGGHFQVYCSRFQRGKYQTPELLPFSAGQYASVDPAVAPDQSFIIFASSRPPAPAHDLYAFIAFRSHGRWGKPVPLGPDVNSLGHIIELRLGPDGHTLYLASSHVVPTDYPKTTASSISGLQQMQSWNDGNFNIWSVDLAPWLNSGMADPAPAARSTPRVFAPDIISSPGGVDCLTFTPDGNTVFFDRETANSVTIMTSHRVGGRWLQPEIAPFSGRWLDHDPVVAPDGSYLIFTSNRPAVAGGKPLRGGTLWRVDRNGGWTSPVRLPTIVDFGTLIFAPGIAANGDIYFQSADNPAHQFHIFRAPWRGGQFQQPVQLQIAPAGAYEEDPAVAPDGSFIVFDSGRPGSHRPERLYIAYRRGNRWSQAIDLGDSVNRLRPWGAHLGPDGHTLYVTSDAAVVGHPHGNHIWYFDLDAWLRAGVSPN